MRIRFFLPALLMLGFILAGQAALQAQSGPRRGADAPPTQRLTPEERAKRLTDRQRQNLGLSDEQYKQLLEINTNHALKHEAQYQEAQKAREQRQAMAKEIEASRDAEMRKVLTDEQYAKYQQNKQQRIEQAKARRQAAPPRGKGQFRGGNR